MEILKIMRRIHVKLFICIRVKKYRICLRNIVSSKLDSDLLFINRTMQTFIKWTDIGLKTGLLILLLFVCVIIYPANRLQASPFPVKGEIFDGANQPAGTAHVYPRYVEIFDSRNIMVGKVGILVEKGIAKLFLVEHDQKSTLVGYAQRGKIFDRTDSIKGSYFWTATWSFIYDTKGKRAGKVKCIAWPRVCAVGVGGYLL